MKTSELIEQRAGRLLTAEDIARVFESSLLTMPVLQKVRLMNRLLHDHPQVFHALLAKPSRAGESPFDPLPPLH